jgi:hypothetical protein
MYKVMAQIFAAVFYMVMVSGTVWSLCETVAYLESPFLLVTLQIVVVATHKQFLWRNVWNGTLLHSTQGCGTATTKSSTRSAPLHTQGTPRFLQSEQ